MQDPYKILGINNGTSDEEITKAYRKLVKKYHPDLHPGDKEAEKKMREINEAYEIIKKGNVTTNGYSTNNYTSNNPYNTANLYSTARHFVNIGAYRTALRVLSEIGNKTAEWYYLSAIANYYMNNKITALTHAGIAVKMEPKNVNYKRLLQQIQGQASQYNETSKDYGRNAEAEGYCFWCCMIELFLRCCCNTGFC